MAADFTDHKLTAIFYADIAGYSRHTARDELGTHRRAMAILDYVSATIVERGGTVLRYAGDAILAEFPSTLKSVQCAIDAQTELAARAAGEDNTDPVQLRIGINIGEVLQDRGEIYGDGVNLAARLEAAADPGGLCISAIVYQQIGGKIEANFVDGGQQSFKNIPVPTQVYHWREAEVGETVSTPLALPSKPSIAILAFENMSSDPDQQFFAEGISEDIITELSRFRSLFVIARNSSFAFKGQATEVRDIAAKLGVRYVVEGSVRRAGSRLRITAQLIDAVADRHLWAERYDRDLEDIFAVQDEVTRAIVTTIEPQLLNTERQLARRKPAQNLSAWEAYQRGIWHIYQYKPDDNFKALGFMQQAIELDPGFAPAHAGIAFSLYVHLITGSSTDRESDLQRGLDSGLMAVQLDEFDPFTHVGLGRIRIVRGEHSAAIESFNRAIELNPSFALAYYGKAHSLWHAGQAEQAVACHDEAIRLSPSDPLMWTFLASKAIALFLLERYDEALDCSRRAQQYPITAIWAFMAELATLGTLERHDEAALALERALQLEPRLDMPFIEKALPITDPASASHFYDGLKKAGVALAQTPADTEDISISAIPKITVQPFSNLSSDPDQAYFSEGITDDIVTALSKISNLLVIDYKDTGIPKEQPDDGATVDNQQYVRYRLQGSVRKSGQRIRVSTKLTDTLSGQHLWADRYDRDLEDIFAVQDEIVREIVVALDVRLVAGEQAKAWAAGTENLHAWELVRQGLHLGLHRADPETKFEAKRLIEQALELDPDYATAWVTLGWIYQQYVDVASLATSTEQDKDALLGSMLDCAEKAINADPDCAEAYCLLAMYYLEIKDYDSALATATKSVTLAPNNANLLLEASMVFNKTGHSDQALTHLKRAKELCPMYRPGLLRGLGLTYYLLGDNQAAVRAFEESIVREPKYLSAHVSLAAIFGESGDQQAAAATTRSIHKLMPEFSVSNYLHNLSFQDSEVLRRVEFGLRKAGLTD